MLRRVYLKEMGITNDLFTPEAFKKIHEDKLSSTCLAVENEDTGTGAQDPGIDNLKTF